MVQGREEIMENFREELFKLSKKAICHGCSNIENKCAMVQKVCDTDAKIGKGYVSRCTKLNKPIDSEKEKG